MKRYVAAMIRDAKTEEGLTEENFKVGAGPTEQRISNLKQLYSVFLIIADLTTHNTALIVPNPVITIP